MSSTVTVNEHVAVPQELVAVAVTVVVPMGNSVPGAGEIVTAGVGDPAALTVKLTIAPHCPGSLVRVMGAWQTIEGGSLT